MQMYTATANGTYTVVVTDSNGCTNTSSTGLLINVGIEEFSAGVINVFPNPVNEVCFRSSYDMKSSDRMTMQLHELTGRGDHLSMNYKSLQEPALIV